MHMSSASRIDPLQSLWLRQLHQEFTEICQGYQLPLRPPIFAIADTDREVGSWCPQSRILRLSRRLITGYPWSVTLQVLKHEMAHQLCSEYFTAATTPHGELFQRACERLGVLPEFRRAGSILAESLAATTGGSLSAPGRRCIERVKKLLALAESANEHEAALALEKARELSTRHHLSELDGVGDEAYCCLGIDRQKKRIARYQKEICAILGDFFWVRCVLADLFRPESGEFSRVIQIFGSRANVAVAEYCYHFLDNRLASLWASRRRQFGSSGKTAQPLGRNSRASYFLGILRGFREKLASQRHPGGTQPGAAQRDAAEERALLVLADAGLDRYIGLYHPRLCRRRSSRCRIDAGLYHEGVSAGRRLSFAEGLAGQASIPPARIAQRTGTAGG